MQNNFAQSNFAQVNHAQSNFTQSISKEDIYAGFFVRLAAYLIDTVFLSACLAVPRFLFWVISLSSPDNFLTRDVLFSFSPWNIVEYLLCTAYFVVPTYLCGMTLGKKAMRIRVIAKDGGKPSLFTVIYRETIGKYLSTVILSIGYLLIGIDKEKRGLHDMLADTLVIYHCKVVEYKQQTFYTPIAPPFAPAPPQGNPAPQNPLYSMPQSGNPAPFPPQNGNPAPVPPQNGSSGPSAFSGTPAETAETESGKEM